MNYQSIFERFIYQFPISL